MKPFTFLSTLFFAVILIAKFTQLGETMNYLVDLEYIATSSLVIYLFGFVCYKAGRENGK